MQTQYKELRRVLDRGVPLDPTPSYKEGLLGHVRVRGCSDHSRVEAAGDEVRQKPKLSWNCIKVKGLEYLGSRRKGKENLGRLLVGSGVWISRQRGGLRSG